MDATIAIGNPMNEPSVFAYAYPNGGPNTPLYLNDADGHPVPLGRVTLTDEWTTYTERTTRLTVLIRRADCGAGCRCAAEYTID